MIKIPKKPLNLVLAGYSYLRSSVTGKAIVKGMPVSVGIELTNGCNLECPECITGSDRMQRAKGFMSIDLFTRIMKELSPWLYNTNLYFQGEPMMHPLFFSFLEHSRNTHTTVSTNGHFLSDSNAERIVRSGLNNLIISLDGLDQETYATYRKRGNLNTVLDGIKSVTDAKKRVRSSIKIEIQMLVSKFNEHQIPMVKKLVKSLNASLRLKSMQINSPGEIGRWLPQSGKFRRYIFKNGEYVLNSRLPDRCARLWFNPVITWDGMVIPCCFDKNADHIMGDLNQDSFREIWDGPKYMIFRKSVLSGRHMTDICRNCTSGIRGIKH